MDINSRSIIVRMAALGISADQLVRKTRITKDRMGYILNVGKCEDAELDRICTALAIRREMILANERKDTSMYEKKRRFRNGLSGCDTQ